MSVLKELAGLGGAAIALICAYGVLHALTDISWQSLLVGTAFVAAVYAFGWIFLRDLSLRGPQ